MTPCSSDRNVDSSCISQEPHLSPLVATDQGHYHRLTFATLKPVHALDIERRVLFPQILLQQFLLAVVRSDHSNFVFAQRSEEHTSELQSLMRISYAVFFLIKK